MILAGIFLFLVPLVTAGTVVLNYSRTDQNYSSYNFITDDYDDFDHADLSFIGYEDKIEGLPAPYLYSNNWQSRIIEKDGIDSCTKANFSGQNNNEVPAFVGRLYCLRTAHAEEIIEFQVTALDQGWNSVTIKFPDSRLPKVSEPDMTPEPTTDKTRVTTPEPQEQDDTSIIIFIIDIFLLIFIVYVIIQLRRF